MRARRAQPGVGPLLLRREVGLRLLLLLRRGAGRLAAARLHRLHLHHPLHLLRRRWVGWGWWLGAAGEGAGVRCCG